MDIIEAKEEKNNEIKIPKTDPAPNENKHSGKKKRNKKKKQPDLKTELMPISFNDKNVLEPKNPSKTKAPEKVRLKPNIPDYILEEVRENLIKTMHRIDVLLASKP